MKRFLCGVLILSLLLSLWTIPAVAANSSFYLPNNLTEIENDAFAGDTSITSIVIPKSVQRIGSHAFANCSGLTDVYIGNNPTMNIALDAFEGCKGILFHVYPDSSAELFALSHGFRRETLEPNSPAWERAMSMIGTAGFSTNYFNSAQYSTKRLVVKRSVDYLPDISDFNPVKIIDKGYYNIFIIQFDSVEDTEACHSALLSDGNTIYAEEDRWHEADSVIASGVVDSGVWDTDDPMGFDTYAPFVKSNSSGAIKIAIVDSGVKQMSHYNSMLTDGKNMMEDIDGQSWSSDTINHGSVIASIIKDCVGTNNVRLIPVRVIGSSNQYDDELVAAGIDYAVEKGATIINLSMSFPQSSVVRDAINHATGSGVTVVVAAGNDARSVAGVFPANLSNVVTVSGISPGYKLSTWSNYGSGIDYCAPDNYINTTAYSNSLKRYTSFAAPMIASALALVKLDSYHSISDMNATCILTGDSSSFGHGLPQLHLLATVNATGITLDTNLPDKMKVGDSLNLSWTITPSNATNQTVTPTSSNTNVLQVSKDANGSIVLTAVDQGTANITLTVNDSDVSVTSKNIVVERPVTDITITGAPSKLIVGKTVQLSKMVSPSNATNDSVTWHSANNYASVSSSGLVTGLAEGTAVIYATADDGYGVESNRLSFPVVLQPDAESITLYINNTVVSGQTVTLEPNDQRTITYSVSPSEAEQQVDFEVLSGNAVTVTPNGIVKAVNSGSAVVMGMASTGRNVKATVTFNVIIPETSISVSASSTTLDVGGTMTCTGTVSPDNATYKSISWSSNNTSVATVNSSTGVVTAVAPGQASIIATTYHGKTSSVTITVRQPYTLYYNANGGSCSTSSTTEYSGYAIGDLPTPTRSGCTFKGWYTAANGGTQVTSSTKYTSSSSVTIYAHWESGWVLESAVPSGAKIIATSWSYRESTESTSSSMSGWTANGNYWQQTGTGSKEYASFPSTYKTSHSTYTSLNGSAYESYENDSTKRTVSNTHGGYVYWHWMYSRSYDGNSSGTAPISSKSGNQKISSSGPTYDFKYFYAIKSTTDCPYLGTGYCCNQNIKNYDCRSIIPSNADTSSSSGLGTYRFFRLEYFVSTYTDYQKIYKYYRDVNNSTTDPGNGSNITNKTKYVKWSNNQ